MKNLFNKLPYQHMLSTSMLLIELKENQLTLASAKKRYFSSRIYITNVSNIKIEPTAFNHGTIYQPSLIQSHISEFLHSEKLSKPKTLVSVPDLNQKYDVLLLLAILQATLCIAKTDVKIAKITDAIFFDSKQNLISNTNIALDFPNLLEFLGSKNIKNPYPWLIGSVTFVFILFTWINSVHLENRSQMSFLQNSIKTLQSTEANLVAQVKDFAQIKKTNAQIKSSISKIEHMSSQTYSQNRNPSNYILEISSKMPATAYLTNINFTKIANHIHQKSEPGAPILHQKSTAKAKGIRQIELEGASNSIQCVNHLIRNLSKNTTLFKNLNLVYIKKAKKNNSKNIPKTNTLRYEFRASGELNYIC
jgi:Tfp pilus assembly protein PilN